MSAPTLSRTTASPPATRPSRPSWRDPRLAIGIGLVALCALLGARLIGNADDTVPVWASQADRAAGQALAEGDLEVARVHFDSVADADRYVSAADPLPEETVLTRDVGAGELLPRSALGAAGDADLVQLPVTLPSQAVPATLREGAMIDLWVTAEDSDEAELVFEGVRVLALPVTEESLSPSADRQVIVGLDLAQQEELPLVPCEARLRHGRGHDPGEPVKIPVLLAAGGATWEASVLKVIEESGSRLVLLKRCMDLSDLLATAAAGSASVAVIGARVAGLDADTVATLQRGGLSVVVVRDTADHDRIARLGVDRQVDVASLADLPRALEGAAPRVAESEEAPAAQEQSGEVIAVWGPSGAPGRTTVAVGIAAELAHLGLGTLLLDADPFGGAVAQHLGVLDQVSGLLAGARLANAGQLDSVRLAGAARRIHDHLRVLSGLPRADRWVEVRAQAFDHLLETATTLEPYVVVDTGFCLEQDPDAFSTATARHAMTLATLDRADHLVVVGAADPVGLTRLVRGLHDLAELVPGRTPLVAVNRMRGSLGWSERDVASTINSVAPGAGVHFLPDDRPGADKALMAGRSLVESGDSALRRGLADLAQAVSSRYSPVTV